MEEIPLYKTNKNIFIVSAFTLCARTSVTIFCFVKENEYNGCNLFA